MNPCLCAQTRRAARLLTTLYEAELGKAGLTAAQFELLTLLSHGEHNGRAIARSLALDTTTVSRNLKPLLAAGLVTGQVSGTDARQTLYALTSSGTVRLRQGSKLWAKAQSKMAGRLTRPIAQMLRTLQQLAEAASLAKHPTAPGRLSPRRNPRASG